LLSYNKETLNWSFGPINWDEFWSVVKGNGPCNEQRMSHHIKYHNEGAWVREAALAFEENLTKQQTVSI
jgi:ring-1,2-phenylacetyl-CoA epoxidase subunit PaaA